MVWYIVCLPVGTTSYSAGGFWVSLEDDTELLPKLWRQWQSAYWRYKDTPSFAPNVTGNKIQ